MSLKALWPFLFAILLLVPVRPAMAQAAGKIVSIVGKAEVFRAGESQPARLQQDLLPGDVVKTGLGSRVAILLADESQIKVNANSSLEIKQIGPPPGRPVPAALGLLQTILNLLSGEIWIRSRVEPLEIRTPAATATIRGTELNLAIRPADESRLAVLEGVVEFHNPRGSVLVAAREQATARVGEAPRKTVLVNPLDAVQWSLYYPGIVSFRDYPLRDVEPPFLPQRQVEAERKVAAAPERSEAWIELGEILFDLGKPAEARRAFQRALAIDPRAPGALTGLGWVNLIEERVQEALEAFRQARPPPRLALVGAANALYRLDRLEEAADVIAEAKRLFPTSPQPWTQSALLHLFQGRVSEALSELARAIALDPRYALAHGLLSNVYLIQNKKDLALQAAQQAVAANPSSPSAHLDLSLVQQAEFRLEEAMQEARKAVELDPDDPQALIQVSRLHFGMGRLSEAFKVAEQARQRAPQDPFINTTWGFLLLARGKVQEAIAAFDQAIQADSTRGEPHLGGGLALFRQGKTEEAVQEMRIATLLEPQVSLFHSYLGKALYEVKRDQPARDAFALAKALDPRDPTPWFYDAIRNQSVNRPVEALHDLQKSIELNDNRAVYRSRLLLDEDLAARGATLARIHNDLGFQQLALVEGWKSLNVDPANYSAHRFLSDSYAALPRHEIARVSELLQSQLLQPINITPVQPQLAESNLLILSGAGPAEPSMNEFTPLFTRNRLALLASGIVGGNNALGDEVVQSGIVGKVSYSLGQFHYETAGFRENNDLRQDIYNVFAQASLPSKTGIQAELRYRDTESGDLALRFHPNNFNRSLRQELQTKSIRLGFHRAFPPHSHIIASVIYQNADANTALPISGNTFDQATNLSGYTVEVQHLLHLEPLSVIGGVGYFNADTREDTSFLPFFSETAKRSIRHRNLYLYSQINYPKSVTWTIGGSADFFTGEIVDHDQFNPKLGLTWTPFPSTTLRMAVLRTLKKTLVLNQTVEPTQLGGFNQFFDDVQGTRSWRYGIGIDQKFPAHIYAGAELSRRDLEVPFENVVGASRQIEEAAWEERLGRAYLYWTPQTWLALSTEYQYERFERPPNAAGPALIAKLRTHRLPVGINLFHPWGFSAQLKATYIDQEGNFVNEADEAAVVVRGHDRFWVVDTSIGYRLPKRLGLITLTARNLFDNKFKFQDTDPATPQINPKRLIFARLTLAF